MMTSELNENVIEGEVGPSTSVKSEQTLFGQLPVKVKKVIVSFLPYPEQLSLRLISRSIRREVTPLINFNIRVDDRSGGGGTHLWRFYHSIYVNSAKIVSLPLETDLPSSIFQHPGKVGKIEIAGRVALTNIGQLLSFDGLCDLSIDPNFITKTSGPWAWDALRTRPFPNLQVNLRRLSLWGPVGENSKVKDSVTSVIFKRFLQAKFYSLEVFKLVNVESTEQSEAELTALVLRFLVVHSGSLRSVSLKLTSIPPRIIPKFLPGAGETLPLHFTNALPFDLLSRVKLTYFSVSPFQSGVGVNQWVAIIHSQTVLKEFTGNISGLPFLVYRTVIDRNYRTLTSIRLTKLSLWDGNVFTPLNLSLFSKCTNLKKLYLKRQPLLTSLQGRSTSTECVNLTSLPESLLYLGLDSFRIKSSSIIEMLEVSQGLKTLNLTETGRTRKFGVNVSVLLEILLKLSNLEKLSIYPLIVEESEKELAEKVFNAVGKKIRKKNQSIVIDWEFKNRIPLNLPI